MTSRTVLIPAVFLLSGALAAPAFAQHHARDRSEGQPRGESSAPRDRGTPRAEPGNRPAPQTYQRAVPRTAPPRYESPRTDGRYSNRGYDNRSYGRGSYDNRSYSYGRDYDRRYNDRRSYGGGYYGRPYGYGYYGPRTYVRPFSYMFRPRLRIGFGVYLGYPLAYPYSYPYYPYAAPAYGYPGPMVVQPGAAYGGVSLQLTPGDADVIVDGTFVGRVDDFYDPGHPLTVAAGRHRIQIQAPGYVPLVFDVDVAPGQVIPYQGQLQPY